MSHNATDWGMGYLQFLYLRNYRAEPIFEFPTDVDGVEGYLILLTSMPSKTSWISHQMFKIFTLETFTPWWMTVARQARINSISVKLLVNVQKIK